MWCSAKWVPVCLPASCGFGLQSTSVNLEFRKLQLVHAALVLYKVQVVGITRLPLFESFDRQLIELQVINCTTALVVPGLITHNFIPAWRFQVLGVD